MAEERREMRERYLIKLVRDRIAGVPNVIGSELRTWQVGRTTHAKLLKAKLLEEVGEYLLSPSVAELADIYEVLVGLAVIEQGTNIAEVRKVARCKAEERGGFTDATVLFAEPRKPKFGKGDDDE
jgi:predicted house-cleaning noncanonical NTP pyrophosphatase (MazG superfamily)